MRVAGGILCASNRFIGRKARKRANLEIIDSGTRSLDIDKYRDYRNKNIRAGQILPRSMNKLDDDISVAMKNEKALSIIRIAKN